MKIFELHEDGRIVKGVNTTVDVGPDEIKTQAAKFGNTVDRDGKPPTLSKKVKGKSTNVLFNLGLTEGIQLRLERDKHIDVLHIVDTKEKNRVEIRGKKGYERGNYDAQDKLHQVLDRVGKAANISELMNGEPVSINPNHPQGPEAIKTARDVLQTESKLNEMQLAIIEGGHSLDDYTPKPKNRVVFNLGLFEEKATLSIKKNYNEFARFCVEILGIRDFPKITMTSAALDRTFGYFDTMDQSITVSYNGRHQMDTMRTLAHELVHCKQREEREELDGSDGSPDENEANAMAGVLLRRWADKNPQLFSESVEIIDEAWSEKYKSSIDCNNPRGFSQKAHCAGRNKNEAQSPRMNPAEVKASLMSDAEKRKLAGEYEKLGMKLFYQSQGKEALEVVALILGGPVAKRIVKFLQKPLEENFADGKEQGNSRPGRVKRAGASCDGSVTELRRKARNASGEKAKMYHWCANMKAGRQT